MERSMGKYSRFIKYIFIYFMAQSGFKLLKLLNISRTKFCGCFIFIMTLPDLFKIYILSLGKSLHSILIFHPCIFYILQWFWEAEIPSHGSVLEYESTNSIRRNSFILNPIYFAFMSIFLMLLYLVEQGNTF